MSVLSALSLSRAPAAAFVVIGLFWGSFAAMVPVLKARIGVGDGAFGTILLFSAAGLLTAMWLGPRIDRAVGARSMQILAVLFGFVMLLPGVASTPVAFAATMIALGLGSGMLDVIMNARVSDLENRTSRALMNANHGMFSLAYAVSAVATGFAREAGWPPLAVFGTVSVAILILAVFLRMETEADVAPEGSGTGVPLWPVLLCGGVTLLAFASEASVEAWSALHIERTLGGGAAEGALGPAMLGLTMAFGRFSGQALSERLSEFQIIISGTVLAMAGLFIAAAAPNIAAAYLGFGIMGLGASVIGPIAIGISGRLVPSWVRTETVARTAVLGFMAFFVAPTVMGLVSEAFGLRIAFATMGVLVGFIFVFLPAIRRLQAAPA